MKEKASMSFADFSGKNGSADFKSLLEAMNKKAQSEIDLIDRRYTIHVERNKMSVHMRKTDIELARAVTERLLDFLQHYGSHAFIGLRFEKYVVQFMNGHLDCDENGKKMPMHAEFDESDETFIKSLNILQPDSGELSAHSLRSGRAYENHVVVGPLSQLWASLKGRGSDEQIAKTLGFEFVSNPNSLGEFEDNSKCPVERLCIYSQEIAKADLSSSVLDAYDRMKKLRRFPSCIFRLREDLEIHVESNRVSFSHFSSYSKEISDIIAGVLDALKIENLGSASVSYLKDNNKEQIKDSVHVQRIEKAFKIFWSLILCFAVVLESIFVALLAYSGFGVPKAILAVLPGLAALLFLIKDSEERDWLQRIGSVYTILIPMLVHMVSLLAFSILDSYVLMLFPIIAVISYIMEKYQVKEKIKESKGFQSMENNINLFCQKIFSNRIFKVIWTALFVIISVSFLFAYGFIALLAAMPILFVICFILLLSRDFRNDFKEDLASYEDKFFTGYARRRPEMTQYCIIRVKKSRCPKLLIWAPLKILYRTLRRNAKEKYPKQLLFSSIKAYWKKAGEKIKN